jgi:uncharacterized coiled-coil protein SlyX
LGRIDNLMNKALKLEKKKAQYENRIRALEHRVVDCQKLIEQQHLTILYLKS